MELKEFIKLALADITNAIKESQTELSNGALINPIDGSPNQLGKSDSKIIDFDILVTLNEKDDSGKGISANINVLSAKFGKDKSISNETASRIRFSIPVIYPPIFLDNIPTSSLTVL